MLLLYYTIKLDGAFIDNQSFFNHIHHLSTLVLIVFHTYITLPMMFGPNSRSIPKYDVPCAFTAIYLIHISPSLSCTMSHYWVYQAGMPSLFLFVLLCLCLLLNYACLSKFLPCTFPDRSLLVNISLLSFFLFYFVLFIFRVFSSNLYLVDLY